MPEGGAVIVAGLDEVGLGALAGPLVVCAAAFRIEGDWEDTTPCPIHGVRDSKAFPSHAARKRVALGIEHHAARVDHHLARIEAAEINGEGLAWALREAFQRAVRALKPAPDLVLVDGNNGIPGWLGKQKHKPKGDVLWWPVSAASVLAKVWRDEFMAQLPIFPPYGFERHRGYGTKDHIAALQIFGPSPQHRTQFVETALRHAAVPTWKKG